MLAHVVEAGVVADHLAGFMLGLVHHLRIVRAGQLSHGHERGPQRVGRVLGVLVTTGYCWRIGFEVKRLFSEAS